MVPVNTSMMPVMRPETLSGTTTFMNARMGWQPSVRAARISSSSMDSITPISESSMSGMNSWI